MELRSSDTLKRNIPGWENAKKMKDRFDLMCRTIVEYDDRERFMAMTSRRSILRKLDAGNVYYVNFHAIIDDETHTYQLKFTPGSEGNNIKSCIVGVHNIDEDTQENSSKEINMKEES